MFATFSSLRYWKSEHDETTCEDMSRYDGARGLFAIADGVGTALYSNIWASILVDHFLAIPLLGNDPFEVEWWIRQAQDQYKIQAPQLDPANWNAKQKAQNQGSYSTLATLRIISSTATSAQAELLALGDSCIFIHSPRQPHLFSFPLSATYDFELAPLCWPSKPGLFDRQLHRCHARVVDLFPDDMIILATDTVARWIMSAGHGTCAHPLEAFEIIFSQTTATWNTFIDTRRYNGEMIDDDCSALSLHLYAHPDSDSDLLGSTFTHRPEIRARRHQDYEQARRDNHKEKLAITYGNGNDLQIDGLIYDQQEIAYARSVADALKEVITVLRQEINNPAVTQVITPVWQKHATLLSGEPCAANLRQTLQRIGVLSSNPSPKQPATPPANIETSAEAHPFDITTAPTLAINPLPSSFSTPVSTANETNASTSPTQEPFYHAADNASMQALPPAREASDETISNFAFTRYSQIKKIYLSYKKQRPLSDKELEQQVLQDITVDAYIKEGIHEINTNNHFKVIAPETALGKELKEFKKWLTIEYTSFLQQQQLTDEEVKGMLLVFLRADLFNTYLKKHAGITLNGWLEQRRGAETTYLPLPPSSTPDTTEGA